MPVPFFEPGRCRKMLLYNGPAKNIWIPAHCPRSCGPSRPSQLTARCPTSCTRATTCPSWSRCQWTSLSPYHLYSVRDWLTTIDNDANYPTNIIHLDVSVLVSKWIEITSHISGRQNCQFRVSKNISHMNGMLLTRLISVIDVHNMESLCKAN